MNEHWSHTVCAIHNHWQTGKSMNEFFSRVNGKTFCQKATELFQMIYTCSTT